MAATPQNLKDFFALSGNNPAVTNGQLVDVSAWLAAITDNPAPDSDDLVDHIYATIREQVLAHKRGIVAVSF